MFENTSIIPPHITPPDPLAAKVLAFVFSMFLSFVLLLFIGFVSIEFLADMLGHPLNFGAQSPTYNVDLLTKKDTLDLSKSPFELITPRQHTQMQGPEVVVIYTHRVLEDCPEMSPDLLIDGTPHPWEVQFSDNIWFARLQLQEGLHRVQVEEAEADFFVKTTDSPLQSPGEWAWNHPHPDTNKIDRCYDCHKTNVQPTDLLTMSRTIALGAWQGAESCFVCHERDEHALRHAVLQSTTNQCFRCHSVH